MNKKALITGILISIVLGILCSNYLTYNFNVDPLVFGTDKQKEQYSEYKNSFKTEKEALTVGIVKHDFFKTYTDFLNLKKLTSSIEQLDGVEKTVGIENIKLPHKMGFFVSNSYFLPLNSKEKFQNKYALLDKYRDVTEKFLSKDRTSISFYVYLQEKSNIQTISSIRKLLDKNGLGTYHILGAPYFEHEGNKVLEKETFLIVVLGILLLLISMILLTPNIKRIVITILFTVFNISITLIFMYIFNFEITSLTTITPSIIAILSFTDITHILHHYEHLIKEKTPKQKLKRQLFKKIGFPLILTSISNLFGFIIFFFNGGINQITDLAIVSSFGIIFAYFSSRFLLPYVLDYKVRHVIKQVSLINIFIAKCIDFVGVYYRQIIFFFGVILLGLLFPIIKHSKINMQYYEKGNTSLAINKSCAFYDDKFQGIRDIEVVLKSKKGNIFTPSTIRYIDSIEGFLLAKYNCKSTYSLNTIIKRYERYKNGGSWKGYKIPKNITSSLFHHLKKHQEKLGVFTVVSKNESTTRIIGSLPDIGTHEALIKNKLLTKFLSKINPNDYEVYLNGKAFLFDDNVYHLSKFVLISLLIGILITGIIIGLLFKSVWIGLTTLIANVLPLLFGLMMMMILNIDLNPNSIFILTILFGIALDDSIYLLGHLYQSDTHKSFKKDLLIYSLKTNSSPLLITSIVLSILFLALTISSHYFLFTFGLIISTSLIFAFISDLLLIPSLLLLKKYTK